MTEFHLIIQFFFERYLNWRGICIEPMQDAFNKLVQNRRCACINGCIANFNGSAKFFKIDSKYVDIQMLSGLIQKYDAKHIDRLKHDLKTYGGEGHIIDVECYKLNDILKMHGIVYIDYLSLDVEGGELEILESIDFNRVSIEVIDVENNYEDPKIRAFLEKNGYQYVTRIVCDEIYKKIR